MRRRSNEPDNPFMPETSWYRGLCRKLRTPRLPPILNPSDTVIGVFMLLALVIAVSQGLDYVARPIETAPTLSVVEQTLTLDFWGIIFLIFAGLALVGIAFEIWPVAIIGHGVLAFNYLAISLGVLWSLIADWHGYGWNTGVIYFVLALLHGYFADGCYDEWAREWRHVPPPIDFTKDYDGRADF